MSHVVSSSPTTIRPRPHDQPACKLLFGREPNTAALYFDIWDVWWLKGDAYEPFSIGCIRILFISITHTPPPPLCQVKNAYFSRYFSHFFAQKKTESAMDSARRIGSMFHVGIIQSTTVQSFSVFLMYLSCNVKKSLIITWYTKHVALPHSQQQKGGSQMEILHSFVLSVMAGVVANYICKWWDR